MNASREKIVVCAGAEEFRRDASRSLLFTLLQNPFPMKLTCLPVFLAMTVTSLFAADPAFELWADALAADTIRSSPTAATYTQYFSGAEQDALDRQLTPITKAYRAERVAVARRALAELAKFDRARLDAQQRTSAAVIEWSLNEEVNAEPFADFRFVFNQFGGLQRMDGIDSCKRALSRLPCKTAISGRLGGNDR